MKIDPIWRGKTFDATTGFNRLSPPLSRLAMPVIAPPSTADCGVPETR